MDTFNDIYQRLNVAQKQAVDAIDGPVLVIAGPGTGKTQLLSARVAQIIQQTDTLPQNILCLTFTENGAQNMRDRLSRFIGKNAYDVQIGTYHAFGGDLIRRYPEYFTDLRLENPVDELGKRQILSSIVDDLPYSNPLKQTRHHLGDLMSTISEVKRGLLTPEALREIATSNLQIITQTNKAISNILVDHTKRLPIKLAIAQPLFKRILAVLSEHQTSVLQRSAFQTFDTLASASLELALSEAEAVSKTTPLTKWKNDWLAKDTDNTYILAGKLEAERLIALASVLEAYQAALAKDGLYDFDDMILRAIEVLEQNPELKYTLQERYQYLLLDEFQDTNAAQLKLVQLLTDNPVHEGRPNVLAVSDDDQAIYAFQGAQYSNMRDFYELYRDVTVINLSENYRSAGPILETAQQVRTQITERLEHSFPNFTKQLITRRTVITPILERQEFMSDIAQHVWLAEKIKSLIDTGTAPGEIAILAPKHRFLEPIVPYLREQQIPVRYEKRENILEAPVVQQLLTMSKLILALQKRDESLANSLWPIVLSYEFWGLATSDIWNISWQAADTKTSWSRLLLDHEIFRKPALLLLTLANQATTETLETILDRLIGTDIVKTNEADADLLRSPLRDFYITNADTSSDLLYSTLTELTVLRAKLRDHQAGVDRVLSLPDLLDFVAAYEAAEECMINTSPYSDASDAVQLMTVFKAKGLEFEQVLLVACQDEVWGASSHGQSNKLTLPANLAPIRHAGATDDERLRLLFVAITRAKAGLYLTSYSHTYAGKATKRLKYFDESEQDDGSFKTSILPTLYSKNQVSDTTPPPLAMLELNWQQRHTANNQQLKNLLAERLERYQLSPTHLTSFLNLEYGGPQAFYLSTLLRFPSAPTASSAFGTAIHECLEWVQLQLNQTQQLPDIKKVIEYFAGRMKQCRLSPSQTELEIARGNAALSAYLAQKGSTFHAKDVAEHNFRNEGIFLDDIHLGGKIDKLEINQAEHTITVVDYKTGKAYSRWTSDPKLHRYRLQLCCYKLLLEGSHTYRDYTVQAGRLDFIEPDSNSKIQSLQLDFTDTEMELTKKLLKAIWQHVQELNIPDTSNYPATSVGMAIFEHDLANGNI